MSHFHFQKCDKNFCQSPVLPCLSGKTRFVPCHTFVALFPRKSVPDPVFGAFSSVRRQNSPKTRGFPRPVYDPPATRSAPIKRPFRPLHHRPKYPKTNTRSYKNRRKRTSRLKSVTKSVTRRFSPQLPVNPDSIGIYGKFKFSVAISVTLLVFKSVT